MGPAPLERHLAHSSGFMAAVGDAPGRAVDLGSGGGVPGLVLACAWPETAMVLLDSRERRTAFLERAVRTLELQDRVVVLRARAEDAGRDPKWREWADVVVARGFGPPAVVAECAAPLLRPGGRLVVSEPPEPPADRWPEAPLGLLGLGAEHRVERHGSHFQLLHQQQPCPVRFPRRAGMPAKRPLFASEPRST